MFSFRSDKTGFFVTVIMLGLLGTALLGTLAVFLFGDWNADFWIVKVIWGAWWVLCIITVLTRLAIFRRQMLRAGKLPQHAQPPEDAAKDTETSSKT